MIANFFSCCLALFNTLRGGHCKLSLINIMTLLSCIRHTSLAFRHQHSLFPRPYHLFPSTTSRSMALNSPSLTHTRPLSSTQSRIDAHLSDMDSAIQHNAQKSQACLDPLWLPRLQTLQRPEARNLISQLTPDNPLGFLPASGLTPGKTSLSYFVMQQKQLHPEKVVASCLLICLSACLPVQVSLIFVFFCPLLGVI